MGSLFLTKPKRFSVLRGVRFVVVVFLLSRLVIFSAIALSPRVITLRSRPGIWHLDDPILRPLFRWDTGWYLSIAKDGYSYDGNPRKQQNIGFFPLYPLACRLCHQVTGLSIPWCAVALSNLGLLIGLGGLYDLTSREMSPAVARATVLLVAFSPASLFFSTMYTESFYLALSVLAFRAFRTRRFIQGGFWAGLASATRATGITLIVPLLLEGFRDLSDRRKRWPVVLAALLAVSGLWAFLLYQWLVFKDPLAYLRVQQQALGWRGRFAWPFRSIGWGLTADFGAQFSPSPFDAWFGLLFIVLAAWMLLAEVLRSYGVYTFLGVAVPLFTGSGIISLTRYLSVLFPGFMALGIIGQQSKWMLSALLAVFAVGLVWFSMRFAQWYWVG